MLTITVYYMYFVDSVFEFITNTLSMEASPCYKVGCYFHLLYVFLLFCNVGVVNRLRQVIGSSKKMYLIIYTCTEAWAVSYVFSATTYPTLISSSDIPGVNTVQCGPMRLCYDKSSMGHWFEWPPRGFIETKSRAWQASERRGQAVFSELWRRYPCTKGQPVSYVWFEIVVCFHFYMFLQINHFPVMLLDSSSDYCWHLSLCACLSTEKIFRHLKQFTIKRGWQSASVCCLNITLGTAFRA